MTPPRRLTVDPIACTGHGVCAEMLPELIDLDDWGYPRIDPLVVPGHLLRSARRTVTACPALALRLTPALQETSQTTSRSSARNPDPAERWS